MPLPTEPELADGADLVLRRHRPIDLHDVLVQHQDAESQRWLAIPVPYMESDAAEFISQAGEGWNVGSRAVLAVVHRGRHAGTVEFRLDGAGGADLNFGLAPWARGQGVMTRALRLALDWAFQDLDLRVVHWRAGVGNWPARAAATRCGFKVEGTVRGLIAQRGKRYDGWIGSLRRGDFRTAGPHRVRADTLDTLNVLKAG